MFKLKNKIYTISKLNCYNSENSIHKGKVCTFLYRNNEKIVLRDLKLGLIELYFKDFKDNSIILYDEEDSVYVNILPKNIFKRNLIRFIISFLFFLLGIYLFVSTL